MRQIKKTIKRNGINLQQTTRPNRKREILFPREAPKYRIEKIRIRNEILTRKSKLCNVNFTTKRAIYI